MTTTTTDPWPAGDWLLRVTTDTGLVPTSTISLHVPHVGDSDDRGNILAELVTTYLRGAAGIDLGAAVFENRTGLVIINEGAQRFTSLDLDIRPIEEGDHQ